MKALHLIPLIALLVVTSLTGCKDDDSYAARREQERNQINAFLSKGAKVYNDDNTTLMLNVPGNIQVISESEFERNGHTTSVERNEYVYFSSKGVYMQIERKGTGEEIAEGQSASIVTRYIEFNIARDTLQSTNRTIAYETTPDIMTVANVFGNYQGSFLQGLMRTLYGTAAVPSGWLIPMPYIRPGRPSSDEGTSLVRLIVPSTEGQTDAMRNIYPCFYEITYQRGR